MAGLVSQTFFLHWIVMRNMSNIGFVTSSKSMHFLHLRFWYSSFDSARHSFHSLVPLVQGLMYVGALVSPLVGGTCIGWTLRELPPFDFPSAMVSSWILARDMRLIIASACSAIHSCLVEISGAPHSSTCNLTLREPACTYETI